MGQSESRRSYLAPGKRGFEKLQPLRAGRQGATHSKCDFSGRTKITSELPVIRPEPNWKDAPSNFAAIG
jgi:hypothetical protein